MRRTILVSFLFIVITAFNPAKPQFTTWVISNNCFLKVGGSTNVNKFSCIISNYHRPDTLSFYKGTIGDPVKVSGSIVLEVQNFDCHNQMMTGDLRKTLKWKAYPKLVIKFISLARYPDIRKNDRIKGLVSIELAGVARQYEIDYQIVPEGLKTLSIIGTRQVKFSDFNLVPPRRLGGMIQTNNELSVEFNLRLKEID